MQLGRLLLRTLLVFSLVGFVACSDDDANENNQTDTGVETPDAGDHNDALGGDDTVEDDTVEDDTVTAGNCEPGSDDRAAVAREQVAKNEGVNAGEVTFASDADLQSASIDAASGGPAQAATTSYVYVDLDTAEKLELSDVDAFEDTAWDIAFNRAMIRVNSGDSGPSRWMVARVDAGFDEAAPPSPQDTSWKTDTFIADDCEVLTEGMGTLTTAFGVWFDYDMSTHTTAVPENTTWVLYNMESHAIYKFGVNTYDSGAYEVQWAPIEMGR
ncbi:heme-binding HmuY-like protein [Bradymonas sediminis]|uniref:Uncharacterized protein n=1 Tax=Bradymonas sediminis TaxID=1548548 RepID=A0A2Z4FR44_9DELT|nr:hypothetical protein DN745_18645 [Bradymonas sediminis]TDP73802.1 heme-binding HmuY-like protein [Bradymonas sediminis]